MAVETMVCIPAIEGLKGRDVVIKTKLGAHLVGHLTEVRTIPVEIGGAVLHLPDELILDYEEADPIPFIHLLSINEE
jgi:hypothetical protein